MTVSHIQRIRANSACFLPQLHVRNNLLLTKQNGLSPENTDQRDVPAVQWHEAWGCSTVLFTQEGGDAEGRVEGPGGWRVMGIWSPRVTWEPKTWLPTRSAPTQLLPVLCVSFSAPPRGSVATDSPQDSA